MDDFELIDFAESALDADVVTLVEGVDGSVHQVMLTEDLVVALPFEADELDCLLLFATKYDMANGTKTLDFLKCLREARSELDPDLPRHAPLWRDDATIEDSVSMDEYLDEQRQWLSLTTGSLSLSEARRSRLGLK